VLDASIEVEVASPYEVLARHLLGRLAVVVVRPLNRRSCHACAS